MTSTWQGLGHLVRRWKCNSKKQMAHEKNRVVLWGGFRNLRATELDDFLDIEPNDL